MVTSRPRKGTPGIKATTAETAATVALHQRMFDLALGGKNGKQIAAELDVAPSTVSRALTELWAEIKSEKATALRLKWNLRIETALAAIWPALLKGDVGAVHAFCRLEERAAKMHGFDQQGATDAQALADALLADPDARRAHATQLRDELAELRARHADAAKPKKRAPRKRA